MLLTAFVINSLPLNNYSWEFSDLGGNSPFKLEATVSAGYVDISGIEKFDEFGPAVATTSILRDEIDLLYQATTFSALTLVEKEVVSKWFLAAKIDRDTVHTAVEQKDNAIELAEMLAIESIINTADDIKDAEPASVASTVNSASVLAPDPEWLDLNRASATGNQTGIKTDVDIIMDSSQGNGIAYNPTTGVVTLKADKVYRLFVTLAFFSMEGSDTVAVEWVKASDNSPLAAGHETRMRPANAASNGSNACTVELIYHPNADIDVKLRCTEYTHATDDVTMYWERSMATVIEIR